MAKATSPSGALIPIDQCWLQIPGFGKIILNNLPEVSDSKTAIYNSESIIGRSSPLHTYHYSDTRTVSIQLHLYIIQDGDAQKNLGILRAIQSCAYPREGSGGASFTPPPICQVQVGQVLGTAPLCVSLQNYNVRMPSDVAWDAETLCPYKMDIDTTWMVVYNSPDLPSQSRIVSTGR